MRVDFGVMDSKSRRVQPGTALNWLRLERCTSAVRALDWLGGL